jgi:hypothetical protein
MEIKLVVDPVREVLRYSQPRQRHTLAHAHADEGSGASKYLVDCLELLQCLPVLLAPKETAQRTDFQPTEYQETTID